MPNSVVIPVLRYPDVAAATDWLCRAFSFTLHLRIASHRAQLNAGEGAVVIREGRRGADAQQCYSVMVRVEDVDSHHARAIQHGARVLSPPADYPYGERQYSVVVFAEHHWTFSQSVADVDPKDWGGTPG